MIKNFIANRIIKKEVSYLLEVSSIKWKVQPDAKHRTITLVSDDMSDAWIKATLDGVKYECKDESKERELKRIAVGLQMALKDLNEKL